MQVFGQDPYVQALLQTVTDQRTVRVETFLSRLKQDPS